MKRHLAMGGKWLAGTGGVTALGYLVATVAAGDRHPVWPYWLFGVMLVAGLAVYFTCQDSTKQQTAADVDTSQDANSPNIAADDQVWQAWNEQYHRDHEMAAASDTPPGDPVTDRWRQTADGFKAWP
jgi:hypothetical protein